MTNAKLRKLVSEFREYHHAFLSPEGAAHFAEPFGYKPRCVVYQANPQEPKGLTLNDNAKSAVGIAAYILAMQICGHIGVEYDEKLGRGSQHSACCDAIDAWLSK